MHTSDSSKFAFAVLSDFLRYPKKTKQSRGALSTHCTACSAAASPIHTGLCPSVLTSCQPTSSGFQVVRKPSAGENVQKSCSLCLQTACAQTKRDQYKRTLITEGWLLSGVHGGALPQMTPSCFSKCPRGLGAHSSTSLQANPTKESWKNSSLQAEQTPC